MKKHDRRRERFEARQERALRIGVYFMGIGAPAVILIGGLTKVIGF